jgi:hypothetical protein
MANTGRESAEGDQTGGKRAGGCPTIHSLNRVNYRNTSEICVLRRVFGESCHCPAGLDRTTECGDG